MMLATLPRPKENGGAAPDPNRSAEGRDRAFSDRPRITFVNRFFFPDHSATSQLLSDLAFHLAACGTEVRVVTSRQRYEDPRAFLPESETIDGVGVERIATTRFGRSALLGRGVDYLSFYLAVWRSVLASSRPGDIVVAETDPPLLCLPVMRATKRRGLRLVNWLQDLYPELAGELGVAFLGAGPLFHGLLRLRDAALRDAAANVVVGEGMAERLRCRRAPPERIHVIPNWCDDEEIQPLAHAHNPLRREWGIEDRFVIGYSGNLGRVHEYDTALAAAEHLRDHPTILFLFIGGGKKLDELKRQVAAKRLGHLFRFLPYQDRSALKYSLGAADLHWLSLRPEIEGLVVPSKFYGIAAAGRPVVAIAAPEGEIARLVRRHDCGVVVAPGNGRAFADAILLLSAERSRLDDMGRRARAMLDEHFSRRHAFARWHRVLETLAAPDGSAAAPERQPPGYPPLLRKRA